MKCFVRSDLIKETKGFYMGPGIHSRLLRKRKKEETEEDKEDMDQLELL